MFPWSGIARLKGICLFNSARDELTRDLFFRGQHQAHPSAVKSSTSFVSSLCQHLILLDLKSFCNVKGAKLYLVLILHIPYQSD